MQDSTPFPGAVGLTYLDPGSPEPYASFVEQVERVAPHLGPLARWAETLKRPKLQFLICSRSVLFSIFY